MTVPRDDWAGALTPVPTLSQPERVSFMNRPLGRIGTVLAFLGLGIVFNLFMAGGPFQ